MKKEKLNKRGFPVVATGEIDVGDLNEYRSWRKKLNLPANSKDFSDRDALDVLEHVLKTEDKKSYSLLQRQDKKLLKKKNNMDKKKFGRPTKYTEKIADIICDLLISGESLRDICNREDMPDKSTVFRWLAREDLQTFRDRYAQARIFQADAQFIKMEEIEEKVLEKEINHMDYMAVFRSMKWRLSKLNPKKYGERIDIDNHHDGEITYKWSSQD